MTFPSLPARFPAIATVLAAALFLAGTTSAPANPEVETPAMSEAMANSILQNAMPEELGTIFPVGRTFYGVAVPSYDGDKLQSVMRAETITRIDERYLDLENLLITVHTSGEDEETTIFMEKAVYDLVLATLRSRTPAKIEQPQFTMTGNSMTFDTREQISRLRGNVRVVIPDASALAPTMGFPIPSGQ